MAKISIIVPVYKAEKSIQKCIDSVISQTYTDWDLILVDDGSPDNSGKICDEYAKKDSRIKVLHKENSGVSCARNFAIEHISNSQWITCLDADDELQPIFLQSFFDGISTKNIDFAFLSDFICCRELIQISSRIAEPKVYEGNDFVLFLQKYIDFPALKSVHANFFKTQLIKENFIRFDSNIRNGEDHIFVLRYLLFAKSAQVIEGNGYIYYPPQEYSLKYAPQLKELKYKFSIMESYLDQLAKKYNISFEKEKELKWLNGLSSLDIFCLYQPLLFKEFLILYSHKIHSSYETDIRCNRDVRASNILLHLVDKKEEKDKYHKLLELFMKSPKTPLKYIKMFPFTVKIAVGLSFLRINFLLTLYFSVIKRILLARH